MDSVCWYLSFFFRRPFLAVINCKSTEGKDMIFEVCCFLLPRFVFSSVLIFNFGCNKAVVGVVGTNKPFPLSEIVSNLPLVGRIKGLACDERNDTSVPTEVTKTSLEAALFALFNAGNEECWEWKTAAIAGADTPDDFRSLPPSEDTF